LDNIAFALCLPEGCPIYAPATFTGTFSVIQNLFCYDAVTHMNLSKITLIVSK
jgi:hypothetical protein